MIHIIATGYNCADNVNRLVASVFIQSVKDWTLHIVNDGSTDPQMEVETIKGAFPFLQQVKAYNYKENVGAAYRRYEIISKLTEDNDIILLIGLDDELLPGALETIMEQYKLGKWMTYGNWKDQWGDINNVKLHFEDSIHANRSYRLWPYRSTAPNTFYKFLFDHIPKEDFKIDGKWIDTTTESELMFSCLEMCGKEKIGVIEEPIYLYNRLLPNGTQKRLGQAYKNSIYAEVIKRPKKDLLRGLYESM